MSIEDLYDVTLSEVDRRLARLDRIEAAMANHPEPGECDLHADGPISCGWKAAYMDVVKAAKGEK